MYYCIIFLIYTHFLYTLNLFLNIHHVGGNTADLGKIDGHSLWKSLIEDQPSPRNTVLHNLDPIYGTSAYRRGNLKVVNGTAEEVSDMWYKPTGFENFNSPPRSMYQRVFEHGGTIRDILIGKGWWIAKSPDEWYERNRVSCAQPPPKEALKCDPAVKPCLFNITADPCEYVDLADKFPHVIIIFSFYMINSIIT